MLIFDLSLAQDGFDLFTEDGQGGFHIREGESGKQVGDVYRWVGNFFLNFVLGFSFELHIWIAVYWKWVYMCIGELAEEHFWFLFFFVWISSAHYK